MSARWSSDAIVASLISQLKFGRSTNFVKLSVFATIEKAHLVIGLVLDLGSKFLHLIGVPPYLNKATKEISRNVYIPCPAE
ncbi:hypothetical protein L1987_38174 [Smallanthus sonchifolius]|uniref:Uncharacterized protein n=1 Tax=Smallanthus sonchifolius TaxID=185202 RepID=A0ACB9HHX3_9ASTR|nr:hypothetical protein L1987_38174 [Smallanthus sonchifolius]